MIKHHPKNELLQTFAKGELPASLSVAIAIHTDMCPLCQEKIAEITYQQASAFQAENFQEAHLHDFITDDTNELELANMIDTIVADDQIEHARSVEMKTINIVNTEYSLPRAIQNIELGGFTQLGKLSRARVKLDEGKVHSSLLHIQPGGSVPEHTHNGYELTVLLSGEFKDAQGSYVPGDFIMLNTKHTHQPESQHGCLCYTVVSDSLHFTQGINRLLNPIGAFIY